MKSVDLKREIIKIPFQPHDFTDYPEMVTFSKSIAFATFLNKTIKKEMTGKIKYKNGKFDGNIYVIWGDNSIIAYISDAVRQWYPVTLNYSGEDVTYSYD